MMEDNQLAVGLIQMNCRLADKAANLSRAEALIRQLDGPTRIACLPEMFNTGYNRDGLGQMIFDLAEPVPGETTAELGRLARESDLAIVAGVIERGESGAPSIYDTVVLINREGELIGKYRKSHLYPDEKRYFSQGNELPVFELAGSRVGVAICFEHAFPQIFATLALGGAQVVFNPSAVPVGFGYLQDLRTRARAQDNQIFVVAANHVGAEGDARYCGRSQVADPRGEVVAMAPGDQEAALTVILRLDLIEEQRDQEPVFRNFRPELYDPKAG